MAFAGIRFSFAVLSPSTLRGFRFWHVNAAVFRFPFADDGSANTVIPADFGYGHVRLLRLQERDDRLRAQLAAA